MPCFDWHTGKWHKLMHVADDGRGGKLPVFSSISAPGTMEAA
jgi:hypothetical protein